MAEEGLKFDSHDFWVNIDNIWMGPAIGRGKFSTVYVAKYFGDLVAVKKQTRKGNELEEYLMRELSVLKMLNHENLLTYLGAYNEESKDDDVDSALYIVTELCQGGDLQRVLFDQKIAMSWALKINVAKQIASAIAYLHSKQLIHRDIKSTNVLLADNWVCKISDFGMAREIDLTSEARRMTICGTNEYMAPELYFDEEYTFSVDNFSFGMVLFEIINRKAIGEDGFLTRRPMNNFQIEVDDVRKMLPQDSPESLVILGLQCLEYDPSLRPAGDVVVEWLEDLQKDFPNEPSLPKYRNIITSVRDVEQFTRAQSTHDSESQLQLEKSPLLALRQGFDYNSIYGSMNADSMDEGEEEEEEEAPLMDGIGELEAYQRGQMLLKSKNKSKARENNKSIEFNEAVKSLLKEESKHKKFKLFEHDNLLASFSVETYMSAELRQQRDTVTILKSGYLYRRNETGFRNWKKLWCTLTENRFSWVSTDTNKRNYFNLKDSKLKRTKYLRWMLTEDLAGSVDEQDEDGSEKLPSGQAVGISEMEVGSPSDRRGGTGMGGKGSAVAGGRVGGAATGVATADANRSSPIGGMALESSSARGSPSFVGASSHGVAVAYAAGMASSSFGADPPLMTPTSSRRRSNSVDNDCSALPKGGNSSSSSSSSSAGAFGRRPPSLPSQTSSALAATAITSIGASIPPNMRGMVAAHKGSRSGSGEEAHLNSNSGVGIPSLVSAVFGTNARAASPPAVGMASSSGGGSGGGSAGAGGGGGSQRASGNFAAWTSSLLGGGSSVGAPGGAAGITSKDTPSASGGSHRSVGSSMGVEAANATAAGTGAGSDHRPVAAGAASGVAVLDHHHHHHHRHGKGSFSTPSNSATAGLKFFGGSNLSSAVYQREFAAETAIEMEEWIYAIQEAVNDLSEERKMDTVVFHNQPTNFNALFENPVPSTDASDLYKTADDFESIASWLSGIGFTQEYVEKYEQIFVKNGYGSTRMISLTGLTPTDLEILGITHPLHSRLLLNCTNAAYSDGVKLAVNGWCKFDNMVVYKVVSRWKFHRSSLFMRFPNFRRFDRMLRRELADSPDYAHKLHKIPFLPASHRSGLDIKGKLDEDFYHARRRDLESYLLSVVTMLHDTPKLSLLLTFLELVPSFKTPTIRPKPGLCKS